jgi:hypothetical protein
MAGFCVQCGNPVAPGVKFCSKCGAAIAGAPAVSPPGPAAPNAPVTPVSAAPPASQGSSTLLKVILIVVAVFVFLMLLVAGSCFYVAYRVKKKAHEFSRQMGSEAPPYTGSRQPCAMLSAAEAGRILGQPVETAEEMGSTCQYHYGPGGNHSLAIEYTWQGGGMAMGLARGAMKAIAGMQTFQSVEGIGDEAYLAPGNSGLMMRKGDVLVNIDLRASGISVDAAENMARTIASRL